MHYFSHISHTLTFNNKLELAIAEYLESQRRKIIADDKVESFKEEIIAGINRLNDKYPACKPKINLHFYSSNGFDLNLFGIYFVSFHLYKSNN